MIKKMDNPWRDLALRLKGNPNADKCLAQDVQALKRQAQRRDSGFDLSLFPEPYIGRPDAPVVLLNLNPGSYDEDQVVHRGDHFRELVIANYEHSGRIPFYYFDPEIADSPGAQWWRKRLRRPIEEVGLEAISHGLLCVEWFPYHSARFHCGIKPVVPSQAYGFRLVEQSIDRGALIVLMRSRSRWMKSVPRLETYRNLTQLRNPRSAYVSEANCLDFQLLLDTIGR